MSHTLPHNLMAGQPPLFIFTLCLMAFGLTMVILAYIVGKMEIRNPDVCMDWNDFFAKISSFSMCYLPNSTVVQGNRSLQIASHLASNTTGDKRSMSAVLSDVVALDSLEDSEFVETSVIASFQMQRKVPLDIANIRGNLKGHQLGFSDKFSSKTFNISMSFESSQNSSTRKDTTDHEVCLTVNLPSAYLQEIKSPQKCKPKDNNFEENLPIYFSDVLRSDYKESCFVLEYSPDANLNEMLSFTDRSMVNVHLMHTSYFMFVMVITLMCYSVIKGKHRYAKNTLDKISLDP